MDLKTYISDMERRKALAAACNTSPEYLWQIATSWRGRKASIPLAKRIEAATCGQVTRQELLPDVFGPPPANEAEQKRAA